MLFNGDIFGNIGWNYYHLKHETNPETWYVDEKFLGVMICCIPLKRSWNVLFTGDIFENVNWNYYHLKP